MKKIMLVIIFTFLMSGVIHAQNNDTLDMLKGLDSNNINVLQLFGLLGSINTDLKNLEKQSNSKVSRETTIFLNSIKNKKLNDMDIIVLVSRIIQDIGIQLNNFE